MAKIRSSAISIVMTVTILFVPASQRIAQASPVSSFDYFSTQQSKLQRSELQSFMASIEVKQVLLQLGVDPEEVERRIDHLSDTELAQVASMLESRPVGAGHGVGSLIGALLFVFVVLLITDILGLTKVFPFTRAVR